MSLKEECGIVAIVGNYEAANLTSLCLHSLQHRGQESAGIVVVNNDEHQIYKSRGLVSEVFTHEVLQNLKGDIAIGHVRYSTTGSNRAVNAQPISVKFKNGNLSLAHNGNFTNSIELRRDLENHGAIFSSTNDTEILVHLIAHHHSKNFEKSLISSLMDLEGAFSLVILHDSDLYAVRDRMGIRPLCYGQLKDGAYIFASESCALDIIGAEFIDEVAPGEMISIKNGKFEKKLIFPQCSRAFCVFEYIYIMRPDSITTFPENSSIYSLRFALGQQLAIESPLDVDVIFDVPDSARPAAHGYSESLKIPYRSGLVRSHYIGRTFIAPQQEIRDFKARLKYNVVRSEVRGKKIAVVDDSIIRGTTGRRIVNMLREAGAKEINFLSTAPIWRHPCYYGVDTPDPKTLIGNVAQGDEKKIAQEIGADFVKFLSIEGLLKALPKREYCLACFSGEYPAGCPHSFEKESLEKKKCSAPMK